MVHLVKNVMVGLNLPQFGLFLFLPTMTFFFLNVMVDENLSHFQLIWFSTTMTSYFDNVIFFSKTSWLEKFSGTLNFSLRCHGWKKNSWTKKFHEQNFIERIIFSKFGQKRHGWAEICQIPTYFLFLPTMTFFFLNVMVDENISNFQLIWFFTTMTFFLGNVIFFSKTSWLEKCSGTLNSRLRFHDWKKKLMTKKFMNFIFSIERIVFSKFD